MRKLSEANKGKIISEETKAKLSVAASNKEKVICPHCGFEADLTLAKRYHMQNCIHNPDNNPEEIIEKRRNTKIAGESNVNSKLKAADIIEIRRLVEDEGLSKAAVGRIYNIRDSMVCKIVQRKSWAHVV